MSRIAESQQFFDAYKSFVQGKSFTSLSEYPGTLYEYVTQTRREWNEGLNKQTWLSDDFSLLNDTICPANSSIYAEIGIAPHKMMPFKGYHPYAISSVHSNTRSRFAQLGPTIYSGASAEIARTLSFKSLPDGSIKYSAQIPIANYAACPVFIEKGTDFFYQYYWDGQFIQGEELKGLLGDKIIIDEQNENKTWRWWYGASSRKKAENIQGIAFLIDAESRRWIPPSPEPISISGGPATLHNRGSIDQFLQPIEKTGEPILWIAQTSEHVRLEKGLHGLMDTLIPRPLKSKLGDREWQVNSVFINGKNTNSNLRTEIVSPTTEDLIPHWTVLRFIRDNQ